MNSGRKLSPTQPPVGSAASSADSEQSNRSSPFPPASGADSGSMAATAFPNSSHAFRPATSGQIPRSSHSFVMNGTPFSSSPAPSSVRVLLRRLPLNLTQESINLMLVWSKELMGIELLSPEKSEDEGFRSAIVRFKSMNGATEAKAMLDGRCTGQNDGEMIVEILGPNGANGRRSNDAGHPGANGHIPTSAAPGGPTSRQQPQFSAPFQPLDKLSPSGIFPGHEFVPGENGSHFQNIFSPQSPIGNHLNHASDRARISSKSLITGDYNDDDDTSNLLKDPVAYAESNASQSSSFGRRATAPQIPVGRMANLTLNTSSPPGASSLPQHMNSLSPVSNAPSMSFNGSSGQHFGRHQQFPPVNPADQNPPCNTLYVGNLPIDTSEEELKAMFSKQRGYKRLCFRTKQNGPMCFVEFEDISFATKALHELYGQPLHNSVKGGIRLSFSKNPLGVRSGQVPTQSASMQMPNVNGIVNGPANGFSANGPPPGLSAPPGLGSGRSHFNGNGNAGGNNPRQQQYGFPSFPSANNNPWNTPPPFANGSGPNGNSNNHSHTSNGSNNHNNFVPRHMMGR